MDKLDFSRIKRKRAESFLAEGKDDRSVLNSYHVAYCVLVELAQEKECWRHTQFGLIPDPLGVLPEQEQEAFIFLRELKDKAKNPSECCTRMEAELALELVDNLTGAWSSVWCLGALP